MDFQLYESVLNYYKCFCTKTSDVKNFFGEDSSFFFIGKSGQTLIAYGKADIERLIEEQFWTTEVSKCGNTLIAFNINIEKKDLVLCPKTTNYGLYESEVSEVAVVVVANLKGVHTEDDIKATKELGRRFVQTFVIQSRASQVLIKSTFFSYLVPKFGLLNANIKTKAIEVNHKSRDESVDEEHNESDDSAKELDFQRIVDDIDKLIDENSCEKSCDQSLDFELSPSKVEANRSQLVPISVDEVFAYNQSDTKRDDDLMSQIRIEQYLSDIWSETKKSKEEKSSDNNENNEFTGITGIADIDDKPMECNPMCDSPPTQTSFASVLRDNLQTFRSPKPEDKSSDTNVADVRIIANCAKTKLRAGVCGDRRYELYGQQNITIMGAQNLEDFAESQIIFVANIPVGYPKSEFKRVFEVFGKVLSIKFVERIGVFFAFVYFES